MPTSSLSELLERLLRGDEAAWRILVRDYTGVLLAVARRTFASHGFEAAAQDAEDAVAEVWRNLLDGDGRLIRRAREQGHFLPLLVVLTRNRSVDCMRRRKLKTEPLASTEAAEPAGPATAEEPLPSVPPAAWRTLTPRERVCVQLFYLQRKKYREIAGITGIAINSIGPTLRRALAKLRQGMDPPQSARKGRPPAVEPCSTHRHCGSRGRSPSSGYSI
jgi:RNA polymerase sigma-70 factor (ECF subfamily)